MELKAIRKSLITVFLCVFTLGIIFNFKGAFFYFLLGLLGLSAISYLVAYIRHKRRNKENKDSIQS